MQDLPSSTRTSCRKNHRAEARTHSLRLCSETVRSIPTVVWVAVVLSCARGAGTAIKKPQHLAPLRPPIDVSSKNLAPKDELDALLDGVAGYGRTVDVIRIAVPPPDVHAPEQQKWIGEAAAAVMMSELSRVPGVSVLERAELQTLIDLQKANVPADTLRKTGKILGAQVMLVGTIQPMGSNWRIDLRPVRVEDGTILGSASREAPERDLTATMHDMAEEVPASLGVTP